MKRELRMAISREIDEVNPDLIVPVRIGALEDLPRFLEDKHYIDLASLTEDEWLAAFDAAMQGVATSPSSFLANDNLQITVEEVLGGVELWLDAQGWAEDISFVVHSAVDIIEARYIGKREQFDGWFRERGLTGSGGQAFVDETRRRFFVRLDSPNLGVGLHNRVGSSSPSLVTSTHARLERFRLGDGSDHDRPHQPSRRTHRAGCPRPFCQYQRSASPGKAGLATSSNGIRRFRVRRALAGSSIAVDRTRQLDPAIGMMRRILVVPSWDRRREQTLQRNLGATCRQPGRADPSQDSPVASDRRPIHTRRGSGRVDEKLDPLLRGDRAPYRRAGDRVRGRLRQAQTTLGNGAIGPSRLTDHHQEPPTAAEPRTLRQGHFNLRHGQLGQERSFLGGFIRIRRP